MEPYEALVVLETSLRQAVRDILGSAWMDSLTPDEQGRIRATKRREDDSRDGTTSSDDLLDYTFLKHLYDLIDKNWDRGFQNIFGDDKDQLLSFLRFPMSARRNTVFHVRDLVPFERDLLSGVAGRVRNNVALYRGRESPESRFYPRIERISDNFGNVAHASTYNSSLHQRIDEGEVLEFSGTALQLNAKWPVKWLMARYTLDVSWFPDSAVTTQVGTGDTFTVSYRVTERDVNERFCLAFIITTDWQHHRHRGSLHPYDDYQKFVYAVNPSIDNDDELIPRLGRPS